jgi:2-polyprenyl-6-methoxyphenol hydroxylase-like FAD-dependent oxidoreductase
MSDKADSPEVVLVGGGIGGSALATVLSRAGISTLILEKSAVHVDHVRGEWVAPWGVAETERLGLYDTLLAAGGHHLGEHIPFGDDVDEATARAETLDFAAFAGAGFKPPLCMRHPDMCNLLNATATKAGATLLREVSDVRVVAGTPPAVHFRHEGRDYELKPRLVIGADGRNSVVRGQVGIELHRDPTHHLMAGLLVDDVEGWPESLQTFGTEGDINFLVFPQSPTRARLYICYGIDQKRRFAGTDNQSRFLDAFRLKTVPCSEILANGTPAGPCNSYGNEDTWTDSPLAPGVVLIGDAAGHNDPIIGQGLSITYRDVRIVRDLMLENREWAMETFRPYAEERSERMRRLRMTASALSILNAEFGPAAQARRVKYREERARGGFIDTAPVAFIGPESLPAEAFRAETLHRLRMLV